MTQMDDARWSDSDPSDAGDVMFTWEDGIIDPEVTPLNGASPEAFGLGTSLLFHTSVYGCGVPDELGSNHVNAAERAV